MNTKELLIAAKLKISNQANWTQSSTARNFEGECVNPTSDDAVCWCTRGALQSVDKEHDFFIVSLIAESALKTVMDMPIDMFNDTHEHYEVMAAFDRAISLFTKGNNLCRLNLAA